MRKIIAFILCAAMLLSLAACGSGDSSAAQPTPTPQATPEPTPQPTPDPVAQALESYEKSMTEVLAADSLRLELAAATVRVVDGFSFEERVTEEILCKGLQTEAPMIYRDRSNEMFGYVPEYEYMYVDGTVYINESYAVSMSAEDYIASLYPLQLLDTSLYAEVSLEDGQLILSQPGAPESWLGIEAEELLEAEGHATFGEDGTLSEVGYKASYVKNGVQTSIEVKYGFAEIEPELDLSKHIPGAEEVMPLSDMRLVELLDRLYCAAGANYSETSSCTTVYQVDAGALYMSDFIQLDVHGEGDDLLVKIEENQQLTESGQQYSWLTVGSYADGIYTVDSDGEVTRTKLSPDQLEPGASLVSYVITPDYIESAEISEINGYLLVEFECAKERGSEMQEDMCSFLYGSYSLLDDLASAYATDVFCGHMAFDLYTMLPTGYALEYAGHHTIEGGDYNISLKNYLSFDMTSTAAYKNITGEILPETEPENKAAPLFYKVTGENGQEMWLLGTIHVGDERTSYLPESLYSALEGSDALAVEIDVENMDARLEADEALADQYYAAVLNSDGDTVDQLLDAEIYESALRMMKATGNYTVNIEYFRPYTWLSSIENSLLSQSSSLSYDKGVDMRLSEYARSLDIPVWDVEPLIERTELVYGMSAALVEYLLADTMSYDRLDYAREVEEMFELWCQGDEDALREFLLEEEEELSEEEQALYDEYAEIMYIKRNAQMLEKAIEYLESGETVFYAVGLAHLIGMDGLVDALREAGYTVEIVK